MLMGYHKLVAHLLKAIAVNQSVKIKKMSALFPIILNSFCAHHPLL